MTVTPTFTAETLVVNGDYFTWGTKIKTYLGQLIADIAALATDTNAATASLTTANANITALQTLAAAAAHTGDVKFGLYLNAPTGWVKLNGTSIGNASSGGTARANADAQALFTLIWTDTAVADCPIQDSTGAGTIKGASAAADFAANKRLVLPDARAMFLRGLDDSRSVDTGRALASYQADAFLAHTHDVISGTGSGDINIPVADGDGNTGNRSYPTTSAGGTETRPRNIAALAVIKL